MDNPSTTPFGSGPAASLPGTQDRAGRGDAAGAGLSRPGAGATDDAERLAKQGAEQIAREARDLKDSAKQGAAQAAGQVRDAAGHAAEQAKQQAGQLASQLREKGAALFDQQRGRLAELIGDCASATRRAAQKLHDENDHNLAGYADAFAEGLESTRRYVGEQDARRLVDDAADLARRRPEWVLGGAFVAGLAIARFLKASRPEGAAYGSYRYDRPEGFDATGGYGGSYGAGNYGTGNYGGSYGNDYGAGYAGGYAGASGVREYGSPMSSPGDAYGQPSGPAGGLSGSTGGSTLDTPGIATTATGSWTATGAGGSTGSTGMSGTAGEAPAISGPDPTISTVAVTPASTTTNTSGTNLDPDRRDNPEVL